MNNLGLGVMIKSLAGNKETQDNISKCIGKQIKTINLINNTLIFNFLDNSRLELFDSGQSCCENRYMNCDDNLEEFENSILLDMELKKHECVDESEWGDCHEVQFLDIKTSKGIFTISNHNEHNGYYGGFWIEANLY